MTNCQLGKPVVLEKRNEEDQNVALGCSPEGKPKRGRLRKTWKRKREEKERNEMGWPSWRAAEEATRDRPRWRDLCLTLYSSRRKRIDEMSLSQRLN